MTWSWKRVLTRSRGYMQAISVTPAMEPARNWYANGRGVLLVDVVDGSVDVAMVGYDCRCCLWQVSAVG